MKRFLAPLFAAALLLSVIGGCQTQTESTSSADQTTQEASASSDSTATIVPGTYEMDAAHSEMGFSVRHMGLSNVSGHFDSTHATIRLPQEDLSSLEATATAQVASINTGNSDRDGHLQSPDFFAAQQYPEITFESTSVENVRGNQFTLVGDLTMRDTTKTVELDAEYMGAVTGPQGNTHTGFTATGTINRQDFGLTWNRTLDTGELMVGDEIELNIQVEGIRQDSTASSQETTPS